MAVEGAHQRDGRCAASGSAREGARAFAEKMASTFSIRYTP